MATIGTIIRTRTPTTTMITFIPRRITVRPKTSINQNLTVHRRHLMERRRTRRPGISRHTKVTAATDANYFIASQRTNAVPLVARGRFQSVAVARSDSDG